MADISAARAVASVHRPLRQCRAHARTAAMYRSFRREFRGWGGRQRPWMNNHKMPMANRSSTGSGCWFLSNERPEIAAYTNGWFPLRGKNYDALCDQVHHGAYAGCEIDMWLSPLVSEPPDLVWNVDRPVFIMAASVRFARTPPSQEPHQPRRRKGLFSRC